MSKQLLIFFLLTFCVGFTFAQCGSNEIQVKVFIHTDGWGEETSWILSDLKGTLIMQGGQGGVYESNTTYADSSCVLVNECMVFEIYDTWGDGIFAPNGCEIYLDDMLVFSAANEIGSYAKTQVNCSDSCGLILRSLNDLYAHINLDITLDAGELLLIGKIFTLFPECLAISESNIVLSKSVVEAYDQSSGALFTTPKTRNGFSKNPAFSPGFELERAMIALQQGIFDRVFTPHIYKAYPEHLNGWKYDACINFPGYVEGPADSSVRISVLIRANFEDPEGMNPYYAINGEIPQTEHALRPTGLYLAPGSVAVLTLPQSLVGQDYYIRVGAHEWDLSERPHYRRFDRISKKFPIDANTVEVFNPFGGAISILVPYGANDGNVEISVTNAVEAPFFSLKSFHETSDFNAEMSKPGLWAVFETDNVMFTIPKHSIVPGQYDLMQAMQDWEKALRGVNSILARQIIPDKHNMYMIADIDIRTGVYSIGYPMSNTPLRYTDVPGPAYFINGPGPDDEVNFHEMGHALAISKFEGEEEALVNFPYIMALNYGLGVDLNESVKYSFVPNTFDIDKTASHRMVSNTFGSERDISNTTTDEVRYQHRGYGHYFEIVNILGWCPLRNFWKQESIDFENGINHGINDQDHDERILRMSIGAQADLRPLFHFFGILPKDAAVLQNTFTEEGILPSARIYNRMLEYFNLLPKDNSSFVNYALSVYPNLYTNGPTDDPNYGVGWHYLKSLTYDEAEAQERADLLQSIMDLYFPSGEPTSNSDPDVCCLLDTLQIDMLDEGLIVIGGVQPYDISIDTLGNVVTINVVDYDGCTSSTQIILSSTTEVLPIKIGIYPNPASTEIYVNVTDSAYSIEHLRIVSAHGKALQQTRRSNRMNIADLAGGVYILQIELSGGERISKKILILR
jgi:hypothetical protein